MSILFLFNGITVFSQVKITKSIENEKEIKTNNNYDSLKNFLGKEPNKYINQKLYLKEKPLGLRTFGYEGFLLSYKPSKGGFNYPKLNYKCINSNDDFTPYDSIAGKYFDVIDVINYPYLNSFYDDRVLLKLVESSSKDTLYYVYKFNLSENTFPFLVVGYYEKLKLKYINQSYVFCTKYFQGSKDAITGKILNIKPDIKWKCKDVTLDDKYYNIQLVFTNEINETVLADYEYLFELGGKSQVYDIKRAESFKKKFGVSNWYLILNREVKIGFTEEMVKLSFGEPIKINKASYGDQWVYKDQYLYFENGKLKSFN
jgi:hypothetical protein